MTFGRRRRDPPRVDLTPLIDVIFQLVLFFMVSTTFISAPGFQVDLPRSSADALIREEQEIQVWMTSEGEVYVDREPMSWEALEASLRRRAEADPSTLVVIKADTEVDHGRVVEVLDLARNQGLSRLAIATEPEAQNNSQELDATP